MNNEQNKDYPITEAYIESVQGILANGGDESWTDVLVREHAEEVAKDLLRENGRDVGEASGE